MLFCFGFLVADLVIVADVVRGRPPEACNGLLCLIAGITSGPLVARHNVVLAIAGGIAAPLLLIKWVQQARGFMRGGDPWSSIHAREESKQ